MFISLNNNDQEDTSNKDKKDSENVFPDDLPPKSHFRGFERMPRVLCERYDITPFLSKQNIMKPLASMRGSYKKGDLEKYLRQCSVYLVREDLEILKQSYNRTNNTIRRSILNTSTTKNVCKICDKVYTSIKKLQNHVESKHMIEYKESKPQKRVSFSDKIIIHEFKEYHRCRKCPKIYEDYNSLKLHMKQMHKKRKCYICFYCNIGFADRMFFKVHIKMHCSLCGKLFESKKSFYDHKRTVCRIVKKYECKTCKEIYFSHLSLKDHSYEHEGVVFVCDICKERCKTKCTLLHHIQYLHCKTPPKTLYDTIHDKTGVTYECNSCDHCSNNKEIMVDHTIQLPDLKNSKTTGYKDYFFCDQCSEQFVNETEMLRHQWSHFNSNNKTEVEYNNVKGMKVKYKVGEELPSYFKPKIMLDRLKLNSKKEATAVACNNIDFSLTTNKNVSDALITNSTENGEHINKIPLIDKGQIESNMDNVLLKPPKVPRKATLLSNHQCQLCGKYFSTKYCLRRHVEQIHMDNADRSKEQDLQCPVCEETFVWESLLTSHKCIRIHNPDIPFQDARPDIQFDNRHIHMMNQGHAGISEDVNLMFPEDYEAPPTPIVELTEFENVSLVINDAVNVFPNVKTLSNGLRLVIQEVPIEF